MPFTVAAGFYRGRIGKEVGRMAATLKQIAELAGVSRGTVDRALYDRGRVGSEVAKRIKKIAADLNYQPHRAGRALALAKKPIKIGILIQSVDTQFMQMVLEGIETAKSELEDLGAQVFLREIESVSTAALIRGIDEMLQKGVGGLAILPTDDDLLRERLNSIDVPVVTFNSDIDGARRMCFIGLDNLRGGRTAAGLMDMLLGGSGRVLVMTGHLSNRGHNQRIMGFTSEIKKSFPGISLLDTQACNDNDEMARSITLHMLRQYPDISGIYLAAGGANGICSALRDIGGEQRVKVIAYDLTDENRQNMEKGYIDFLIGQDSFSQGYRPSMLLFDYLFSGKKPEGEHLYTDVVIKTKYNF